MYDIVGEFEKKGIEIGKQKATAEYFGIQAQCLISDLERRFPDFPDDLKERIRRVTDANKLIKLAFCAGSARSPEEIARQLEV